MALKLFSKFCKFNLNHARNSITSKAAMSTAGSQNVQIDVNDKTGYATVKLNRPPANSFTIEFFEEITSALKEMERNKARGVILTSAIPKVFCSGLDISQIFNVERKVLEDLWRASQDTWLAAHESTYPLVCVLNGHTVAGGCFLAMACEYRIMMSNFKIGINEVQLGVAVPAAVIDTMKTIISPREAELALVGGKLYSTEEAFKVGLVDEVASDNEDAIKKAELFLDRFRKIPPAARLNTKLHFRKTEIEYVRSNREQDIENFVRSVENPETQNAIKMYVKALKSKN